MKVVHVECRLHLADDALHGETPVVVRDNIPVTIKPMSGSNLSEHVAHTAVPIEHCASGVKGDGLDIHGMSS
jgi:hypothetical protein